jgi:hypothetical protein
MLEKKKGGITALRIGGGSVGGGKTWKTGSGSQME